MKRNTPQRVYCRDWISRSGPNISPPNNIAPVATDASSVLPVTPHAATKVGTVSNRVIASCVFPEGIKAKVSCGRTTTQNRGLLEAARARYTYAPPLNIDRD